MPIHAYRLVYPDSPHAPEMLWEWEEPHIQMIIQNAQTFHREVEEYDFSDREALAQENQQIWETYYLPRPLYEPWDTWRAWLAEYREIVHDVQDIYEEHSGRMNDDRLQARQNGH